MPEEMTPCDEWANARHSTGYGYLKIAGVHVYAHRLSWMQSNGPIPDGLVVRHRCDNPSCVNIDHLEIGTRADNARDMAERGRAQRVRAAWTACSHGHAFDEANTYITPDGRRNCRNCRAAATARYQGKVAQVA